MVARIWAALRGALSDKSANTAILVALCFMVMLGAVGVSIDLGRAYIAKSKLQASLDAAGLAAGSDLAPTSTVAQVDTMARRYLEVNFDGQTVGASITNFTIDLRSSNTIIDLDARAQLPTTFMGLFGHHTMRVAAKTEITRSIDSLELVLVLDVTSSMWDPAADGGVKINALRNAARTLVDILFDSATAANRLWVGIVPFSQAVNVGPTHLSWLDPVAHAALPWGSIAWAGCVEERTSGRDVDDTPPVGADRFRSYFRTLYPAVQDIVQPNLGCPVRLTPMSSSRAAVQLSINNLFPYGYTMINVGAVWGWRMLSPRWRGEWGGDMNANMLPGDYHRPGARKAIVLMSDGDNEMPYFSAGAPGPDTTYGLLSDGRLGSAHNVQIANATLNAKTTQVCDAMKTNGIVIYTVALGLAISNNGQNLLRGCASEEDFYFYSPSAAQLQAAFRTIGNSLINLRVSR